MENTEGPLSIEEANNMVVEYQGWSESIAKSVARAWNLDWRSDGLDGAAFEALVFCSRRFDPKLGVPFKGYARKRIHEASSEAARRCKSWQQGVGTKSRSEKVAREVSAELLTVYPELRSGRISFDEGDGDGEGGMRGIVQQLLVSASVFAAKFGQNDTSLDQLVDYKRIVQVLAGMEPLHQSIMWQIYWEGASLRAVAEAWETDELNVIREHKVLLQFLAKSLTKGKQSKIPRVRPGLKGMSHKLKQKEPQGIFKKIIVDGA